MQSGFDINQLLQEAQRRWLKPAEVLFILQNHANYEITQEAPQKPSSGSLYLFNKRVLRFFRKDGHNWRKKKDGRTVGEAHERLKVGNAEALNCYYAHGEDNPNFQRRSYWMLDPVYEHIVLVHYREITEGKLSSASIADPSPGPSGALSQSTSSYTVQNPVTSYLSESYGNHSSPGSAEVSSGGTIGTGFDYFNESNVMENVGMISDSEVSQALRRLEVQLSLDDDSLKEYVAPDDQNRIEDDLRILHDQSYSMYNGMSSDLNGSSLELGSGPETSKNVSGLAFNISSELTSMLLDPSLGMPVEVGSSLTVAKEQRFTIREICPEWGFANDSTKVVIIGSFLCDPTDCMWHCMFGDVEVPLEIVQDGVFTCQAPPRSTGKVTICISSGNRESCSEIREFEYREKHSSCSRCDKHEGDTFKSTDEMLLLVRLVQMLLTNSSVSKGNNTKEGVDLSTEEFLKDDSWEQVMESLLVGGGASVATQDWLLQQLVKDKFKQWLSSRTADGADCSLSKKEQGMIHMIAGLGYEWALLPLLKCGVGLNFRDINGCTALHWAARFGREKMVAALIASGASALAVTDPSSSDPTGRNAAYIASAYGHKGLAGYLSEVALTSHLSSLTVEESELSKGSADVEAELTVNSISMKNVNSLEDQFSLKHTLAAVRNTASAAARIQAAFRAHSFRRRQQKEATNLATSTSVDEYGFTFDDIQSLSAASRLIHSSHDNQKAALSIQKNYRGWKGRKDFLTLRQNVVKIQAHVRGYQVRKKYRVICWAVGILDKAVLRWRRKGVGLRGFKPEIECIDEDEDDEDIIKVFRKEKVNVAIDEAVSRVLSMVDSPDARQQYQRMLGKFQQAKAERQGLASPETSTSQEAAHNME